MQQIPRRENTKTLPALAIAVFALCLSWMMWTHVVTRMQVASIQAEVESVGAVGVSPSFAESRQPHVSIAAQLLHPLLETEVTVPLHPAAEQKTATPEPQAAAAEQEGELTAWHMQKAYTISIPAKQISVPVLMPSALFWNTRDWQQLEEQMQVGLRYGAVAYPHSVAPGAVGSIFLSGHSSPPNASVAESAYSSVFAAVPGLQAGDRIVLTANGITHTYTVVGDEVVLPTMTRILSQQSEQAILKLITCYPIGTTRERWVVTAVLDEAPL